MADQEPNGQDELREAKQLDDEHVDVGSDKPESTPDEDGYRMTKTTYLAVLALAWSWAAASVMNASATTISHQVADVGGAQVLGWISNSSLVVQVALQAIVVSLGTPRRRMRKSEEEVP